MENLFLTDVFNYTSGGPKKKGEKKGEIHRAEKKNLGKGREISSSNSGIYTKP